MYVRSQSAGMQRTDQRERPAEATDATATRSEADSSASDGGLRARVGGRLKRVFSPRAFGVSLALLVGGLLAGGALFAFVPLLGNVGGLLGLFAAAFLIGALGSRRNLAEVGLAGATAAGAGFVLDALSASLPLGTIWLRDYGLAIAGVGAGAGLLVSLVGYYFGRDLRAGLTRELD